MKIYTKTGDDGTTGLVGGGRVRKNSLRVQAYGDVDELNSVVGLARTLIAGSESALADKIESLQHELFNIGAQLASDPENKVARAIPMVGSEQVGRLESWIDELSAELPELRAFVLPGGTDANAALHVCRAVCRRAERSVLTLQEAEGVPAELIKYLNRLSDLFFVMARFALYEQEGEEFIWQP